MISGGGPTPIHHATSGNLDRRGMGDIDTLTVSEYLSLSRLGRLRYRLYRHPLVMFGLGPAYLFFLQHRLPVGLMRGGWRPWLSTMATNLAIVLAAAVTIWAVGIGAIPPRASADHADRRLGRGLAVLCPAPVRATRSGRANKAWNIQEAALHGSSHYDLPLVLRWFTANIGVHHVHHLCSRIPFYRLPLALRQHPDLAEHRPAHARCRVSRACAWCCGTKRRAG